MPKPDKSRLDKLLLELEEAELFRFDEWKTRRTVRAVPGVYTIWEDERFIYAGYAGRDNTKSGLLGRLTHHRRGARSGDQFCVYLCDRIILPTLTPDQIQLVASGEMLLNHEVKKYVNERLAYRYVECRNQAEAEALEDRVLDGDLPAGKPFLNQFKRGRLK